MEYASEQVGINAQYCDMIARKAFSARLLASTIKCITGINVHGERNAQINYRLILNEYSHCIMVEN